ncbi:MAG: peptidoglycan DD-metalloendopeptidase family protein [Thermodesulfovibrionales bacterium]|nr:peptidoglycan DD-metalloendopeptidase family protein [Thermodesulfovibrionales bacterium]
MKKTFLIVLAAVVTLIVIRSSFTISGDHTATEPVQQQNFQEICGTVEKGETLYDIFQKYKLDLNELFKLREASADVHRLRELYPGQPYKITLDDNSCVNSFTYWINDEHILLINRTGSGFFAEKKPIEYEKRLLSFGGVIHDNLIESMDEGRHNLMLALTLSDIFAWDIDFTSDLREGDSFKLIVEGLYLDGEFRKYGDILSAEFANNGEQYHAYRFEQNGEAGYYDDEGKSLKRSFLKAPLSFRRISSHFSHKRFHPILRISRPHHGLDYAAPRGTPVSAVGDGTVTFAGHRGQYGKLVIIRHPNGWKTYYGHLSRLGKNIRKGEKLQQGTTIGYVGSTGMATGPHLHYEIRIHDKPTNPLKVNTPKGKPVPQQYIADFIRVRDSMSGKLALIQVPAQNSVTDEKKGGRWKSS